MKKRVLFIIGTLQSGGVSKSMVNLLNAWDRNRYDTSLLLCCKAGDVFSKYLPADVRVIYDPRMEHVMGGMSSAKWLLLHGYLLLAIGVIIRLVLSRVSRPLAGLLISKMMPVVTPEHYDLIVDYGGQQLLYYMVDKLQGEKKVSFFHNDYSKWTYYYRADRRYYPLVNHIFSISQVCVDALKRYFPDCKDKSSVMENIICPAVIAHQAQEIPKEQTVMNAMKADGNTVLCTVAHFCRRKGSDLAIEAAEILKRKGLKFKWLFIGKVLEPNLADLVKEKGLQDEMLFLGIKSNPYPYMKFSDIYVQPSRFEGKSISLDEAKILCKPVVVTNFSTVDDQFEDGINANICEMTGEALAASVEKLIVDSTLRDKYSDYLRRNMRDNSDEVNKLYSFFDKA